MLFIICRLAFWSLVFVVFFFQLRKSHIKNKRRWSRVALIIMAILTTISTFIPVENAFVTFSSPQSAYNYNNIGNVRLLVHGETTDFIVGSNGDTEVHAIVPKSDNGWKLGTKLDIKRIVQTINDGIIIHVYQYKNSEDYYITVLDTNGGPSEIIDNHSSNFQCLDKHNGELNKTFYTYYAYINDYDAQYTLTVNGKAMNI